MTLHALFVNENLGGHATLHLNLRLALGAHPEVEARFVDVPSRGPVRRLAVAPVPGLDRLDLDLQPLRFQLGQSAVARRLLRRHLDDADVVHLYTHNIGLLSTDLLRRCPTIVSLDATNTQNAYSLPYRTATRWTPLALRPTKALEARVYAAARAVVTHSAWAADSVATYGIDRSKIHVVPFGIEVHDIPDAPLHDPPRITFVGATMARKGGWRLVELFRRHWADRARLTLVTRDEVPPMPGVEVLGDIVPGDPRLRTILASSTVLAFPTEIDAFGYAPIEAMAMGTAVVATDRAALPEIVDDGRTGLLVPPGDDDALRRAIEALLDDPDRARELGAAGRARALERFDARVTTSALVQLLHGAAARG